MKIKIGFSIIFLGQENKILLGKDFYISIIENIKTKEFSINVYDKYDGFVEETNIVSTDRIEQKVEIPEIFTTQQEAVDFVYKYNLSCMIVTSSIPVTTS